MEAITESKIDFGAYVGTAEAGWSIIGGKLGCTRRAEQGSGDRRLALAATSNAAWRKDEVDGGGPQLARPIGAATAVVPSWSFRRRHASVSCFRLDGNHRAVLS